MGNKNSIVKVKPNVQSPGSLDGNLSVVSDPLDKYITEDELFEGLIDIMKSEPPPGTVVLHHSVSAEKENKFTRMQTILTPLGRAATTVEETSVDRKDNIVQTVRKDAQGNHIETDYTMVLTDPLRVESFRETAHTRKASLDALTAAPLAGRIPMLMLNGNLGGRCARTMGVAREVEAIMAGRLSLLTENLYGIATDDFFEKLVAFMKKERTFRSPEGKLVNRKCTYDSSNFWIIEHRDETSAGSGEFASSGIDFKYTLLESGHLKLDVFLGTAQIDENHFVVHKGQKDLRLEVQIAERLAMPEHITEAQAFWVVIRSEFVNPVLADTNERAALALVSKARARIDYTVPVSRITSSSLDGLIDFDGLWEAYLDSILHPTLETCSWCLLGPPQLTIDVPDAEWTVTMEIMVPPLPPCKRIVKVTADKTDGTITEEITVHNPELAKMANGTETQRILKDPLRVESGFSYVHTPAPQGDGAGFLRAEKMQFRLNQILGYKMIPNHLPAVLFDQKSPGDSSQLSMLTEDLSIFTDRETLWESLTAGIKSLKYGNLAFTDKFLDVLDHTTPDPGLELITATDDEVKTRETLKAEVGIFFQTITAVPFQTETTYSLNKIEGTISMEYHLKTPRRKLTGFKLQLHQDPLRVEFWFEDAGRRISDGPYKEVVEFILNTIVLQKRSAQGKK